MSAIGEVIDGLLAVVDQLEGASTAAGGAHGKAGEAIEQATAIGATSLVEALSAAGDRIEALVEAVQATISDARATIEQFTAAADGG